jgi:hypothetical protein
MGLVHDTRRALYAPSPEEARLRVKLLAGRMAHQGVSRWAVVVPASSPVQYGMARLAEALAEDVEAPFRVFKGELEAAIAWAKGEAL